MTYGMKARVGIAFQNSFDNVDPAAVTNVESVFWLPVTAEDVTPKIPPLIGQGMRGIFDEGEHRAGPKTIDGGVTIEAEAVPLGVMFKAVMGQPTTVTSDALFTHTFKPQQSDHGIFAANPPMTYLKYLDVGSSEVFANMVGTTLELGVNNGEFVTARIGIVGGSQDFAAPIAASYDDGKRWSWDQTSVSLGGAANGVVSQLTMTLEESVEATHTFDNTQTPSRAKRTGFRSISISGTLKFDDALEYQEFLNQSERDLTVHWEGNTAVQSGFNESLTLKVPLFRYVDFPAAVEGPGEIEVAFGGKGVYSTSSATGIELVLANGQATY